MTKDELLNSITASIETSLKAVIDKDGVGAGKHGGGRNIVLSLDDIPRLANLLARGASAVVWLRLEVQTADDIDTIDALPDEVEK